MVSPYPCKSIVLDAAVNVEIVPAFAPAFPVVEPEAVKVKQYLVPCERSLEVKVAVDPEAD